MIPAVRSLARGLLPLAAAALLGTGCDDSAGPTEPRPDHGRYALVAVDGHALPAPLFVGDVPLGEDSFHLRLEVTEGYVRLLPDGRYEQRLVVVAYVDGEPDIAGPALWSDRGSVAGGPEALRFASSWIENVSFEGTLSPGELRVSQDLLRHFHDQGRVSSFRYAG